MCTPGSPMNGRMIVKSIRCWIVARRLAYFRWRAARTLVVFKRSAVYVSKTLYLAPPYTELGRSSRASLSLLFAIAKEAENELNTLTQDYVQSLNPPMELSSTKNR